MNKIYLILFFSLLFLNACDQNGCILSYDFNSIVRTQQIQKTVQANGNYSNLGCSPSPSIPDSSYCGKWLNSGVSVNKGDSVNINTSGTIYTCMDPWTITNTSNSVTYQGQSHTETSTVNVNPTVTYLIDGKNSYWTNVATNNNKISLNAGDQVTISVGAPNSSASGPAMNQYAWSETTTLFPYGQWLYALITNDINIINASTYKNNPTYSFFNTCGGSSCSNSISLTAAANNKGNYTFTADKSGVLHFGLYDTANENYYNNIGGYTVNVSVYKCPSTNGIANPDGMGALLAVVSDGQPSSSANQLNINGSSTINTSGSIWLKVNDSFYGDNIGTYNVTINATNNNITGYSTIVGNIINLIETTLIDNAIKIVKNILGGATYVSILKQMLVLYIILYAVFFTMGLAEINQMDLVTRLFKIGVILAFMSNNSWQFFYDNFFRLFGITDHALDKQEGFKGVGTVYYLIDIMTGGNGTQKNPFTFVDAGMQAMFLNWDTPYRVMSLIFTSPAGIFYFAAVVYSMVLFIKSVLKITITYFVSFIYVAIMLILAPIFIPCILFSLTRSVFERWTQYMFRYVLEPILLIVGLSFIFNMMLVAINNVFNSPVCWKCAIQLNMNFLVSWLGITLPDAITNIYCIEFFLPWGYDNSGGGISSVFYFLDKLPYIVFLMIIVKFLEGYTDLVDRILTEITGTQEQSLQDKYGGQTNLTDSITKTITQKVKGTVGLNEKSQERRRFRTEVDTKRRLNELESKKAEP